MSGRRCRHALTVVEMLVVVVVLSLVTFVLYRFFSHYSQTYLRVDERMEHVVQAWQVMRYLGDDLQNADFPASDTASWRDVLQPRSDGWDLTVRDFQTISQVTYKFDPVAGNLFRVQGGATKTLLQGNCKEFGLHAQVTMVPPATTPTRLEFAVKLSLKNPRQTHEQHLPLSLETIIVPEMLNRKLRRTYQHVGLP